MFSAALLAVNIDFIISPALSGFGRRVLFWSGIDEAVRCLYVCPKDRHELKSMRRRMSMTIREVEEVYLKYGVKTEKKSGSLFPPLQYEMPTAYRDVEIVTSDSCCGAKLNRK